MESTAELKFKMMNISNSILELNVRQDPSPKAKILMTLKRGQKVNVNLLKSTDEYFYVASIVETDKKIPVHGFCRREYILD